MESSQDQVIAETAQRLRNGGDIAGAEAYLRQEINMAAERGDRVSEIVGRLWLATTLAFDERWSEGAVVAQQAHEASRYVSPSLHARSALTLTGVLACIDEDSRRQAERILLELDTSGIDSRYEDMRLQRLHMVYRRLGRAQEAKAVEEELSKRRASGKGFPLSLNVW